MAFNTISVLQNKNEKILHQHCGVMQGFKPKFEEFQCENLIPKHPVLDRFFQ